MLRIIQTGLKIDPMPVICISLMYLKAASIGIDGKVFTGSLFGPRRVMF